MCHPPSLSCVIRLVFAVMSSLPCRRLTRHPTRRCACPSPAICQVSPTLPPSALPAGAVIRPVVAVTCQPATHHAITGHPRHASAQPFFPSIYQIFPTPPPSAPPGRSDICPSRPRRLSTSHPRRPPVPCALQPIARRAALTCLLCFGPRPRRLPRRCLPRRPRIFHGHKFGPFGVLPGESDVVSRII